ncbi:PREDICTED: protein RTF2 homolog isoform X1 [Rhagoletis zephyria]|uniref:protein RTF2 homolog isoform X1 n=2 Tax=Rhagoletis zephyria TaxID=28612 RepID=UPI000811909E|nr:PREDICTED: protein RTF2 homolog isoform X1 [Rhagoletis zephyria]
MGCDGGTIPRRDELVRTAKKPEQKDKDAEREFRWLHCALTQQRLQEPIVMCSLGRLYSKQSLIEQLLEKDKMPESIKHIRSLKDIKSLNLTPNPAYTDEDKTEGLLDTRHARYICKLSGLEMSGKFRFVALWTCGCVIAERAIKQIKRDNSGGSTCPLCLIPFGIEDVVILNAADEDLELMQAKMEMRNVKRKTCKKDKKEKKEKKINETFTGKEETAKQEQNKTEGINEEKSTITNGKLTKKEKLCANGPSTSKTAAAVTKMKLVANLKRVGAAEDALEDPEMKRLKNDYSVAKDPKASDVYKSLFTTHKSEKEQSRAHWVTYNPFYN